MLRILIALDDMAAAFMRLDAEIRALARAGLLTINLEGEADA